MANWKRVVAKKLQDGDQLDIPEVGSYIIKFGEQ